MPVNTPSDEYERWKERWERIRDAVEGSDAVQKRGVKYLPMIGNPEDPLTQTKYNAYSDRALWSDYSQRTLEGWYGLLLRKPIDIEFVESKMDHLESVTIDGESFRSFISGTIEEVLGWGRYGALVDMPKEGSDTAYIVGYTTENIYRLRYKIVNGLSILIMVVLREILPTVDPTDVFKMIDEEVYRVLYIDDEDGKYKQQLWRKKEDSRGKSTEWKPDPDYDVVPNMRGKSLDFIPFEVFKPRPQLRGIQKPPLLGVVDANMSHYRSSADLENGRNWNGNPTLWGAGIPKDEADTLVVGSPVGHLFSSPEARLELLELKQGLKTLENALTDKEALIVVLGARMLEVDKKAVESDKTLAQKKVGEDSVLATVANSISTSAERVGRWRAEWSNLPADKLSVKINTDYGMARLTPEMLKELRETKGNGDISFETFYYNLDQGELYKPGWDSEKEQTAIDTDGGGIDRL